MMIIVTPLLLKNSHESAALASQSESRWSGPRRLLIWGGPFDYPNESLAIGPWGFVFFVVGPGQYSTQPTYKSVCRVLLNIFVWG